VTPTFVRDTAVDLVAPGRHLAQVPESWSVGAGPNGGFTAAIVLRAAIAHLGDPAMHPRSFTVHLVGAPAIGPCELLTTTERAGRTAAFVSVRLVQLGRTMATGSAVFVRERHAPASYAARTAPVVPPAAARTGDTEVRRLQPRPVYLAHYEQRFVTPPLTGDTDPVVIGWTRFVDPAPYDAVALAAIGDSFPPPSLGRSADLYGALTLDYTVHFRAALPHPATEPGGFVLAELRSDFATDGLVEEDGWLWAPDGTLLAQVRQLGLLLGDDPARARATTS
jgi:acyl-CoA thioesterase